MDLIMGAGGAVVGGLVMRSAGHSGYSGTVLGTFVADHLLAKGDLQERGIWVWF